MADQPQQKKPEKPKTFHSNAPAPARRRLGGSGGIPPRKKIARVNVEFPNGLPGRLELPVRVIVVKAAQAFPFRDQARERIKAAFFQIAPLVVEAAKEGLWSPNLAASGLEEMLQILCYDDGGWTHTDSGSFDSFANPIKTEITTSKECVELMEQLATLAEAHPREESPPHEARAATVGAQAPAAPPSTLPSGSAQGADQPDHSQPAPVTKKADEPEQPKQTGGTDPIKSESPRNSQSPSKTDPNVAQRRAIVKNNPTISAQGLCRLFDNAVVRLHKGIAEAGSWEKAYKSELCRNRIEVMISKDRKIALSQS